MCSREGVINSTELVENANNFLGGKQEAEPPATSFFPEEENKVRIKYQLT